MLNIKNSHDEMPSWLLCTRTIKVNEVHLCTGDEIDLIKYQKISVAEYCVLHTYTTCSVVVPFFTEF